MSTAQTILIAAPYYPPHTGGLERYAHEVAQACVKEGTYRIVVLTTGEEQVETTETFEGVEVRRLPVDFRVSNTPLSLRWVGMVRRILREVRPDLVHIHAALPGLQDIVVMALDIRVPLIVTQHGGSLAKGALVMDVIAWIYEHTFLRILFARARYIGCSSDFVRTSYVSQHLHKAETLTPGVDSERFFPTDRVDGTTECMLLAIGGLKSGEEHKRLGQVIDTLAQLRSEGLDVQLTVVGDGDLTYLYKRQAAQVQCQDAVHFVGRLDHDALATVMRESDVFVLPSTNDSFPTVILEAMASGLPVVSTHVGSIGDMVVHGETGYLVAPRDTVAFTQHVRMLVADASVRRAYGAAGRVRVEGTFSWRERAASYLRRYAQYTGNASAIVHVAGFYPPHLGGMEVVAQELARESVRRGYETQVLTSRVGAGDAPRAERVAGLSVRRLWALYLAHTPIMPALLLRLLVLPKRSILHVHIGQALIPEVALLAARLRRLPLVAQFHLDVEPSGTLGFLFPYYKRYILAPVLRRADAVLVFSEEQRTLVAERYSVRTEKLHIVPNGVSDAYDPAHHVPHDDGVMDVVFVGRLTNQKRVDRLIRAVAACRFPIRCTIVGDGELRSELEALAHDLCPEKVVFAGAQTPGGVRAYYAQSDVFVLPSDKEGMPLTVLEAMAAGLPVVGSDVVGIRELVGGVGVLVEQPSDETFAAALTELHYDPSRRAQLAAQSVRCAARYRWPAVADQVERVYMAVSGRSQVGGS